jgi:hypothetical protein
MNRIPRSLAFFGILACFALTGCVPNVVWLPDSSGFVFTEPAGFHCGEQQKRLVKYDIAKKQRAIIVDNLKSAVTTWPAISPNGTEVAVASITWDGDQTKLQLIFYGLTGKELRSSRKYDWVERKKNNKDDFWPTLVFWGAPDKVVVTAIHPDLPTNTTAIIDLKSKEIVKIEDRIPFLYPGNIPFRPDGKGFLCFQGKAGDAPLSGLAFVDWNGNETKIDGYDPRLLDKIVDFRWNGKNAIVIGEDESFTIDTETGKIAKLEYKPLQAPGKKGEKLAYRLTFAKDRFEFRTFASGNSTPETRLEILDQNTGKVRVLRDQLGSCFVFPSPDGKWLALRTGNRAGNKVVLINDNGEIAAEMEE